MSKKNKPKIEYRYYSMPEGCPFLALLGEMWHQTYGRDTDCLHFHNYLEIGYCYSGEGTLTLGEQDYAFHDGTFSVIPSNYPHTTNSTPGTVSQWEYLFVDVEEALRTLYHGERSTKRTELMISRINARAMFLTAEEHPRMADGIRWVLDVLRDGGDFYMEEARGGMIALLAAIAKENPEGEIPPDAGHMTTRPVSLALDYISSYYMDPLKVEDMSAVCHMSETHFRRIFTQQMNMSPLEYLNLVRVHASCNYLKKSDESVAHIAEKCGFTTLSTFNRNFKQVTGISPSEWRKRPENYEQQLFRFRIHSEEGW